MIPITNIPLPHTLQNRLCLDKSQRRPTHYNPKSPIHSTECMDGMLISDSENSESLSILDVHEQHNRQRHNPFHLGTAISTNNDRHLDFFHQTNENYTLNDLTLSKQLNRDQYLLPVPNNTLDPNYETVEENWSRKSSGHHLLNSAFEVQKSHLGKRNSLDFNQVSNSLKCQFGHYDELQPERVCKSLELIKFQFSSTEASSSIQKKRSPFSPKILYTHSRKKDTDLSVTNPAVQTEEGNTKSLKKIKVFEIIQNQPDPSFQENESNHQNSTSLHTEHYKNNDIFVDESVLDPLQSNTATFPLTTPQSPNQIPLALPSPKTTNKIQNPKSPKSPKTKGKKNKNPMVYNFQNFKTHNKIHLNKILQVFLSYLSLDPLSKDLYDSLNLQEELIIAIIITKIHKKTAFNNFTLRQLRKLQSEGVTKRNEEHFKCVYKPFNKYYLGLFKLRTTDNSERLCRQYKEQGFDIDISLLHDKRREFFLTKFKELVFQAEAPSLDLIMDICQDLVIISKDKAKSKIVLESENWRTLEKAKAMKKVSGAYRYLVASTRPFRKEFMKFTNTDSNNGLFKIHKDLILKKLSSKMEKWLEEYTRLERSDDAFIQYITQLVENDKFKFPWSMISIKKAVDKCIIDLDCEQISKEFAFVKRIHYSSS